MVNEVQGYLLLWHPNRTLMTFCPLHFLLETMIQHTETCAKEDVVL